MPTIITPLVKRSSSSSSYNDNYEYERYPRRKTNGIYNGNYAGERYNWSRNGRFDNDNMNMNDRYYDQGRGQQGRGGGLALRRRDRDDDSYDTYSYDPYYYGNDSNDYNSRPYAPIFGNGDYYSRIGTSENFRDAAQSRYSRRDNLRNGQTFGGGFRSGNGYDRIQNYLTPREREMSQQRQNYGARYGFQQQYDVNRGNVRSGSSNDFRRGRAFDRYQDFQTPREREMRQMRDNRMLSRGVGYDGSDNYGPYRSDYGGYRSGGSSYGRGDYRGDYDGYGNDDDYSYSSRRGGRGGRDSDYYSDGGDVIGDSYSSNRRNNGRRQRNNNAWDNLANVFKSGRDRY